MNKARKFDVTILKNKDTSNKKYDMNHIANMVKNYFVRRIHPKTKNGYPDESIDLIKLHGSNVFKNSELLKDKVDVVDYQLSWKDAYAVEEKIKDLDNILSSHNYGKDLINEDLVNHEIITEIALKRNFLKKGSEPDFDKAASVLIDEFRNGSLGKISLERP